MSTETRFYVCRFSGYKIADRPAGNGNHKTSFYIMDRWHLHKVVATFENQPLGSAQSLAYWQRKAERECEQLNAWNEAECAHG